MKNKIEELREQAKAARDAGRAAESVTLLNQAFELERDEKGLTVEAAEKAASMKSDIERVSNIIKLRNSRVIRISADPGGHSKRPEEEE